MPFYCYNVYNAGFNGWKFGIIPTKLGNGIIGVNERGRRSI